MILNFDLSLSSFRVKELDITNIKNLVYNEVKEEKQWRVEVAELILLEREQGGLEDSDLELLEWLWTD